MQSAVLRASDFRDATWVNIYYFFSARFGSAVALDGGTLVVGAPRANYGTYPAVTSFELVRCGQVSGVRGSEGLPCPHAKKAPCSLLLAPWPRVVSSFLSPSPLPLRSPSPPRPLVLWLLQARGIDQFLRNYGTGQVYVFELDTEGVTDPTRYPVLYHTPDSVGGKWVEQVILRSPDAKVGDRLGSSIAIHQSQIIVGAPGAAAQVGCGSVFARCSFLRTFAPFTLTLTIQVGPRACDVDI